jgi:glyoxylase-like metal-dependent hydrolase (beta-lactamase superfamily II)
MEIEQLTSWLWCLRTPIVQAYAVRQGDGFNLIDASTAGNAEAILGALAGVDGRRVSDVQVLEVLLTHGHDDHTGSAAELVERTGARVIGPALDAPVIEGRRRPAPPVLAEWERPLFEQVMPRVPPAPPVQLDAALGDGAVLTWNQPARVLAAPGHTDGQIVLFFEEAKVLVAADAMASWEGEPMVGVFNADPAQAVETYKRLVALDIELACFGHGAPLTGNAGERLRRVAGRLPGA